eukprot:384097_1
MAPTSVMLLVCILLTSQHTTSETKGFNIKTSFEQLDAHKETFTAHTISSNDEMFLSTIINQLNTLHQKHNCSRNSTIINDDQMYSTHKSVIQLVIGFCTCLAINTILLCVICKRNNQNVALRIQ